MDYSWNVYKLFKNGKRAKKPFHVFEHDNTENLDEHFHAEVIDTFSEKIRTSKLLILRSDLPQERQADIKDINKEKLAKQRNQVFQRRINRLTNRTFTETSVIGALILCKESEWKWQWAVLEAGTSRYIHGLSPNFKSYDKAYEWMSEEIDSL